MMKTVAAGLAALAALVAASAEAGSLPDNNVFYSLIRTERGQSPPVGWTKLAIAPGLGSVSNDGFFADAFVSDETGQIVIAFRRLNPIPFVNGGTYDTDAAILHGLAPRAYDQDVRAFVDAVTIGAAHQVPPLSTDPANIFVTGNSLGAYGAQIAAKEFHYGGVGFAGPGIPGYHAPPQGAGNFINYLIYGDPVANHAADTGILWAGWSGAGSFGDHYGRIERLGYRGDQIALQTAVSLTAIGPVAANVSAGGWLGLGVEIGLWHMSPRYQARLGIETLPQQTTP